MRSPTSNFNIQLDLVPISFVKITPSHPLQTLVLKGQFGSLIDGYHIPYNNILKTHSKYIMNNKKKKHWVKRKILLSIIRWGNVIHLGDWVQSTFFALDFEKRKNWKQWSIPCWKFSTYFNCSHTAELFASESTFITVCTLKILKNLLNSLEVNTFSWQGN